MIIYKDAVEEYNSELTQLLKEDNELQDLEKEVTGRRNEIKERIKEVAAVVGGSEERVILPTEKLGAWDRRVSFKGGGVNLETLKQLLGEEQFRKLVCLREVVYTPMPAKVEVARRAGKITEEVLQKAYEAGTPIYLLYKMTAAQLEKAERAQREG